MIDLISRLTPWKRIRELEAAELDKANQRISELTKQVDILKDNAAELEMCCKELQEKLDAAQKNDHRDRHGRYAKGEKK